MEKTITPVLIAKEHVASLRFPAEEIFSNKEEKAELVNKLKRATSLGNIEHNKCRITFKDDKEVKQVETTIWATGEKNIVLKHGMTIPIHRIMDVNFFT